jgi:hypothetical protein
MARRGKAGHGAAWRGVVLFLKRIHFKHIIIQVLARPGEARHGKARLGGAWRGTARRGEVFFNQEQWMLHEDNRI